MGTVAVFVGLDYHQDEVQVCVPDRHGQRLANRSVANDWQAIVGVVGLCGNAVQAALESCSGAGDLAEELVQRARWSVDLAHPGFVSRMKQNPDKVASTAFAAASSWLASAASVPRMLPAGSGRRTRA